MNLQISLVSHKASFLENFTKKIFVAFSSDCQNIKITSLPTKIKVFTVLTSPHVNKKSREQFCSETHKKLIVLGKVKPDTLKTFFNKVSCKGVAFKITLEGG